MARKIEILKLPKRLQDKVKYNLKTGCWDWIAHTTDRGYGQLRNGRKMVLAHRYFFELQFGKIPIGKVIDHLCRNRICVNPNHLEAVSLKENIRRGEATKITMDDVQKIRNLYPKKTFTQYELGAIYNIGQDEISRIVNYRRWV